MLTFVPNLEKLYFKKHRYILKGEKRERDSENKEIFQKT